MTIVAGLIWLAATGAASAATPPGNPVQDVSAIDQYVEAIPTSSGPAATGAGTKATPRSLPPGVASEIRQRGGVDAEALIQVATSPKYGAPAGSGTLVRPGDSRDAVKTAPSPLDAVVSPVAEADDTRLLVLLTLIGSMTLAGFISAARRQRE